VDVKLNHSGTSGWEPSSTSDLATLIPVAAGQVVSVTVTYTIN
jgi:hypothetical protein